ncbi:glycosyltransferase family 1 protein [Candidatus Saccharibacteria bacterium CG10_big_fil_rev_8_21_14_0_10_47_8]|nr:MAG: glycosyltransferase family 1 protein [Candidatus Saccharibacteria bacterium CG10_big_fil_rev_8_21_14_0_10_47_8]
MPKAKSPLKIGFVFDDSLDSSDGVAQYVKALGSWLGGQGHEVRYLVGETRASEWYGGKIYSLARNQRIIFNGNRLSIPLPAKRSRIKQVLETEGFDVLHVQVPHSPLMSQRVINAAGPNTAIVGTFHILPSGWLTSWGSRLLRLMYGSGLARFDKIYSVSPPAAEFAKSAFGLDTEILPNVVDINRFEAAKTTKEPKNTKKIVFLGRLVKRKGAVELLRAYAKADLDAELIIAGDGPLRNKLESFVTSHNLGSKVSFLGFIDERDKPGLLNGANIACFPSLYGESFGIVLIEAMAAGAAIVLGGNNPGYCSVLDNKPELLVDPKNTEEFATKLKQLLSDDTLISKLHGWQVERVKRYDVAVVGKQLIAEYNVIIAKRINTGHN